MSWKKEPSGDFLCYSKKRMGVREKTLEYNQLLGTIPALLIGSFRILPAAIISLSNV